MSNEKKQQLRAIKFLNEEENNKAKSKKTEPKKKTEPEKKTGEDEKKTDDEKKTADEKTDDEEQTTDEDPGVSKRKNIMRNFITIVMSSLCLAVSLAMNELFLLYLRKGSNSDIILTIKYVSALLFIILCTSYYLNLQIDI